MPLTKKLREKNLEEPALCELLPIRDYLDNVMVRTSGELVAGYALKGAMSYFADDNGRNSTKHHLEALLRTIPEESMRLQFRFEVTEDLADLLERYERDTKTNSEAALLLEQSRVQMWSEKERSGVYLRRITHVYLIWNPERHHQVLASGGRSMAQNAGGSGFSLSARKQIERTLKGHLDIVSEFESILDGIESVLKTTGLDPRRLSDGELFLENKRALAPLAPSTIPLKLYPLSERFISPREQVSVASILNETEDYINVDGVLWSSITLKSPPDATYPGILREIVTAGIPVVVSTQVMVPNQAKVLDAYKKKQKKMAAAQLDQKGNVRVDVTAQVAEQELLQIQHEIISSTLKTCKVSLTIAVRTSRPAHTQAQYEEAEREIENRKQQILHIISRMNGARAYPENLAQRRIWITTLPGLADDDRREHDLLTPHAADLLPLEMPWEGTPRSPLMLFASPWRQLLPFSPFDPELSDANILIAAASGHGKSMMTGQMLLQAAKQDVQVSIIERGDSYQSVVEFMNGQMITMSLDSRQTINPWDLAEGEQHPGKDQITFLKNLTRHMLDDSERSDAQLLDIVLVDAIERTYHRAAQRPLNPIPTFGDLRDELQLYQDADKNEKVMEEARMAAYKMKNWVGNGVYANLFDRHTNLKLDTPWMYFNVEKLKDDPRLEAAMSLLIAWATTKRAGGTRAEKASRSWRNAGCCCSRQCWLPWSFNSIAPAESGMPVSGESPRRSKTSPEPRRPPMNSVRPS